MSNEVTSNKVKVVAGWYVLHILVDQSIVHRYTITRGGNSTWEIYNGEHRRERGLNEDNHHGSMTTLSGACNQLVERVEIKLAQKSRGSKAKGIGRDADLDENGRLEVLEGIPVELTQDGGPVEELIHYTERMMEQLNAYRELGTVEELSHLLDDLQQRCASCYKLTYGTYCQECYGWNITTRASN